MPVTVGPIFQSSYAKFLSPNLIHQKHTRTMLCADYSVVMTQPYEGSLDMSEMLKCADYSVVMQKLFVCNALWRFALFRLFSRHTELEPT
jgi:hypothetical protein